MDRNNGDEINIDNIKRNVYAVITLDLFLGIKLYFSSYGDLKEVLITITLSGF